MTAPARPVEKRALTKADIARALKAAQAAGVLIDRYEVTADAVRVYARQPDGTAAPEDAADAWLRAHGAG